MARISPYPPRDYRGGWFRETLAVIVLRLVWPFLEQRLAENRVGRAVVHGDPARITVGERVEMNNLLMNVESGTIVIEDTAFFGFNVSLLTGTHERSLRGIARQDGIPRDGRNILIREGAWIASDVIVIGPCRIGRHAVVWPGSVVTKDVADFTEVAGVPARVVNVLK